MLLYIPLKANIMPHLLQTLEMGGTMCPNGVDKEVK